MSDLEYIREHLDGVPWVGEKPVMAEIEAGRAEYLIGRSYGKPFGFVVYSVRDTGAGMDLYIISVWSARYLGTGIFDQLMERTKSIARKKGCSTISFHSPRRGWLRKLAKHGFTEVPQITMRYTLEAHDG